MTDRDRFGLRGSVKSCEIHRTWYSRGCGPAGCDAEERSDVTIVEFRRDGSLHRQWYKNPPPYSSEWTNFYEYRDDNQLVTVRTEQGASGNVARRYEYDSQGRISQMIIVDKEGKERVAAVYPYEADGTKKKIVEIDPNLASGACGTTSCGTMFGVDGTDVAYGAPGATRITTIYDESGRPIEHLFHDKDGELTARVDFRYDERGNLVEEIYTQQKIPAKMVAQLNAKQLQAVRMMFAFGERHRYDADDRRIETSSNRAPNDFDRDTFAYNDHGDVICRVSESSHAEYSLEEDGALTPKPDSTRSQRSETQFRYQYDPNGNWIEKIAETHGGPTWSIERRNISYFS